MRTTASTTTEKQVRHHSFRLPRSTKQSNSERPARDRDHRKEHGMRTNLKKSVTFARSAAVAAAAVPALPFFGAFQANPFDHGAAVRFDPWPGFSSSTLRAVRQ
jgi:hypothetical protein